MKIAMVEWWPRHCGVTDWAIHFSAGAAAAGVTLDRVAFSKSGRPAKPWVRPELWQTHRLRDAVDVLNTYDLVIQTDVACFSPEVAKVDVGKLPYYVPLMQALAVPWTCFYHGGPYPSKHDATMAALLGSESFAGFLGTTRAPDALRRLGQFGITAKSLHVDPYLPYDRTWRPAAPPKRRRNAVLMTARLMTNKGQDTAVYLAPQFAGDLELWGYNAFGLPSIGWRLYELGVALGYDGLPPQKRADTTHLTHPNSHRFYTGRFEFRAGKRRVRYHDAYDDLTDVDWAPKVHLSLAHEAFAGTVEYASLDAVAAGTVAIVPRHAVELGDWSSWPVVDFRRASIWPRKDGSVTPKFEGDPDHVVGVVNRYLRDESAWAAAVTAQRADLVTKHAPDRVFSDFLAFAQRRIGRRRSTTRVTNSPGGVPTTQQQEIHMPVTPPAPRPRAAANRSAIARLIETSFLTRFVKSSSTILDLGGDGSLGAALAELPVKTPHSYLAVGPKVDELGFTWFAAVKSKKPFGPIPHLDGVYSILVLQIAGIDLKPAVVADVVAKRLAPGGVALIVATVDQVADGAIRSAIAAAGFAVTDRFGIAADPAGIPAEIPPTEKALLKRLASVWPADLAGAAYALLYPDLALRQVMVVMPQVGVPAVPIANSPHPKVRGEVAPAPPRPLILKRRHPASVAAAPTETPTSERAVRRARAKYTEDATLPAEALIGVRRARMKPVAPAADGSPRKRGAAGWIPLEKAQAIQDKLGLAAPPRTSKDLITERCVGAGYVRGNRPPKLWANALADEIRELFPGRTTKASDVYYIWRKLPGNA